MPGHVILKGKKPPYTLLKVLFSSGSYSTWTMAPYVCSVPWGECSSSWAKVSWVREHSHCIASTNNYLGACGPPQVGDHLVTPFSTLANIAIGPQTGQFLDLPLTATDIILAFLDPCSLCWLAQTSHWNRYLVWDDNCRTVHWLLSDFQLPGMGFIDMLNGTGSVIGGPLGFVTFSGART